ncbi:MAG: polysaccharide biosynthesis C-terminal domain-containing protein [Pseudomonadota bacterium]
MSFTGQSIASLAMAAFYTGMALLISILLARSMPLVEYGLYASILGHVMVLTALISGLPGYLIREIATADHGGEASVLAGLMRRALQGLMLVTGLVALGAWLVWQISPGDPQWWQGFVIGIGIFAGLGLLNILAAIMNGLGMPVLGQIAPSLVRPSVQLAVLIGIVSFVPLNGTLALIVLLCALIAAILLASNMLRTVLAERPQAAPVYRDRIWLIGFATFGLATGFQRINQRLGTVTMEQLGTVEQVGLLQPAVEALLVMGLPVLSVMAILAPRLRKTILDGDPRAQQALLDRAHWITFGSTLILAAGVWMLGPLGIAAIFGPAFDATFPAVAIIAFGQVIAALFGNPLAVLVQADQERVAVAILLSAAVLNLICLYLLIPSFGIEGAALSTALSIVAGQLVMTVHCYRTLGLRTWLWLSARG